MLAAELIVPENQTAVVRLPFKRTGIRRIILNSPSNNIRLQYNGKMLIRANNYQSLYEITFESYFGYPDSDLFSLINVGNGNYSVTVLADTVPYNPINSDYFEIVPQAPPLSTNSDPVNDA